MQTLRLSNVAEMYQRAIQYEAQKRSLALDISICDDFYYKKIDIHSSHRLICTNMLVPPVCLKPNQIKRITLSQHTSNQKDHIIATYLKSKGSHYRNIPQIKRITLSQHISNQKDHIIATYLKSKGSHYRNIPQIKRITLSQHIHVR